MKQSKCSLPGEWITKFLYMEYYSAIKKKKQTTDWINIDESQRHAKWKKPVTKKALFCDWIYMKSKYKEN